MDHTEHVIINQHNILTDIDALIDTRYALLKTLSPKIAQEVIEDGSYFTRTRNTFKEISCVTFDNLFKMRNKNILGQTDYFTDISPILAEASFLAERSVKQVTGNRRTKLYVIIEPYLITEKSMDFIALSINQMYPYLEVILITSDHAKDMRWIKAEIGYIIMYQGVEWLSNRIRDESLIAEPAPDVSIYLPYLAKGSKNINSATEQHEDLLRMVAYAKPFIDVDFLPAKFFSLGEDKRHFKK